MNWRDHFTNNDNIIGMKALQDEQDIYCAPHDDGQDNHQPYHRMDRRRPAQASDPSRPLAENVGQFPQPTSIGLPKDLPDGEYEARLPEDTATYDYPEGSIAEELYDLLSDLTETDLKYMRLFFEREPEVVVCEVGRAALEVHKAVQQAMKARNVRKVPEGYPEGLTGHSDGILWPVGNAWSGLWRRDYLFVASVMTSGWYEPG